MFRSPLSRQKAPADLVRRLQSIRPCAQLIDSGRGFWMLGEIRPNVERYMKGVRMLRQHQQSMAAAGALYELSDKAMAFVQEAWLLMQGFVWVRDYRGAPDGRIENDYRRMCWKEELGLLDGEFQQMAEESDKHNSILRRVKLASDRIRHGMGSDLKLISGQKKHFGYGTRGRGAKKKPIVHPRPGPPRRKRRGRR